MPSARPRPYHHGDLRASLLRAGYDLARSDGLRTVSLRAVTREVGVSAAAAYRHFDSHESLLLGVGGLAMADLARAIEARQRRIDRGDPDNCDLDLEGNLQNRDEKRAHTQAIAALEAVGLGYVDFALDSPGAFDAAMFGLFTMADSDLPTSAGDTGRTPYQLLTDAVTGLCVAGLLDPAHAQRAGVLCWSAVHGFATLAVNGPFRTIPRPALEAMAADVVTDVVSGLFTHQLT